MDWSVAPEVWQPPPQSHRTPRLHAQTLLWSTATNQPHVPIMGETHSADKQLLASLPRICIAAREVEREALRTAEP